MRTRPAAALARQRWLLPCLASAFALAIPVVGEARWEGGYEKIGKPYQINGQWYYPKADAKYDRRGTASWYGGYFHGRRTANGETYDMHALTAAHPTLPLPSYAQVTNTQNGRTVLVRINDRGPYSGGRVIDLSREVARLLGFIERGLAPVRVVYDSPAPLRGSGKREREFLLAQSWYSGPGATRVASTSRPTPPVAASVQASTAAPAPKPATPSARVAASPATVAAPIVKARAEGPDPAVIEGERIVARLEAEAMREVEAAWRADQEILKRGPWR
jgi:rare lipoprotein A